MNQRTSQAGSSSCQCSTDIVWDAEGNDELCVNKSKTIEEQKDFLAVIGLSWGPGSEGSWNRTAEKMLQNLEDSGHPIFRKYGKH